MRDTQLEVRAHAPGALASMPARRALAVAAFVLLTAIGARIAVPMVPVPITMQTLAVSLAGLLLGARLGALSQVAYLALGAIGLPVFAQGIGPAAFFGPTGGYLLAFPVAAAFTGWFAARVTRPGAAGVAVLAFGTFLGTLVIFAGGWAQLAVITGDPLRALQVGVLPFLAGDVIKVLLAVLVAGRLRARTLGLL